MYQTQKQIAQNFPKNPTSYNNTLYREYRNEFFKILEIEGNPWFRQIYITEKNWTFMWRIDQLFDGLLCPC